MPGTWKGHGVLWRRCRRPESTPMLWLVLSYSRQQHTNIANNITNLCTNYYLQLCLCCTQFGAICLDFAILDWIWTDVAISNTRMILVISTCVWLFTISAHMCVEYALFPWHGNGAWGTSEHHVLFKQTLRLESTTGGMEPMEACRTQYRTYAPPYVCITKRLTN